MFTDPQRQRKSDPGRPEVCNVFSFHNLYSPETEVGEIERDCRKAAIGCVQCKKRLALHVAEGLKPIHEKQEYYRAHIGEVHDIIADGNDRAQRVARATMMEVRDAVRI
jgi:tryptophanyl-tRNA synthetase